MQKQILMLLILHVQIVHQVGSWQLQSLILVFFEIFVEFFFIFRRILFITEISFLGLYETDWKMKYMHLQKLPVIIPDKQSIQILVKVRKDKNKFKIIFPLFFNRILKIPRHQKQINSMENWLNIKILPMLV